MKARIYFDTAEGTENNFEQTLELIKSDRKVVIRKAICHFINLIGNITGQRKAPGRNITLIVLNFNPICISACFYDS